MFLGIPDTLMGFVWYDSTWIWHFYYWFWGSPKISCSLSLKISQNSLLLNLRISKPFTFSEFEDLLKLPCLLSLGIFKILNLCKVMNIFSCKVWRKCLVRLTFSLFCFQIWHQHQQFSICLNCFNIYLFLRFFFV